MFGVSADQGGVLWRCEGERLGSGKEFASPSITVLPFSSTTELPQLLYQFPRDSSSTHAYCVCRQAEAASPDLQAA